MSASPDSHLSARCLLFAPAGTPRLWSKALATQADLVCLDLEDGTAPAARPAARRALAEFLASDPLALAEASRITLRISPWGSADWRADVAMLTDLAAPAPRLVILPKTQSRDAIEATCRETGRKVIALIEDPASIEGLAELSSCRGLAGLFLGGADLNVHLPFAASPPGLAYPRSRLLYAASARGLLAIDTPMLDFRDLEALKTDVQAIRVLGYRCKAAIHPAQVPVIRDGLAPTREEVNQAKRLVAAGDQSGASQLDGMMIDAPVLARARALLAAADEAD